MFFYEISLSPTYSLFEVALQGIHLGNSVWKLKENTVVLISTGDLATRRKGTDHRASLRDDLVQQQLIEIGASAIR